MNNPIQQLVDAAKRAYQSFQHATPEWNKGTQMSIDKLEAAIKAVESAQVETRWELQFRGTGGTEAWYHREEKATLEDARNAGIDLLNRFSWLTETRIVRLDTYRSVESDQK